MARDDGEDQGTAEWSRRWWATTILTGIALGAVYALLSAVVFGTPAVDAAGTGAIFGVLMTVFNVWTARRRRA
jgi:hypothetical protein